MAHEVALENYIPENEGVKCLKGSSNSWAELSHKALALCTTRKKLAGAEMT